MKYRKKPIEAFCWTANMFESDAPEWLRDLVMSGAVEFLEPCTPRVKLYIDTPERRVVAIPGDYIIRGVKGEVYPCRADVFAATYEPVTDKDSDVREDLG